MAEPATMHPGNDYSNLPVGEILRRTRVHYNQSIQDVERNLRIRAEQIKAIEENNMEKLPGRVYAIGFVRSYSEYLGLDGNKMVELFKAQSAGQTQETELRFPIAASESKAPPLWLALFCLVAMGIALTVWLNMRSEDRAAVENVPEVPAALKPEVLEEEQSITPEETMGPELPAQQTTQAVAEPAAPPPKGITLNIKENSWVEIKDVNRNVVLSRVLNAGEQYFVPDRANLTMSIGNANGVELQVDGVTLNSLGEAGQVIRDMPLDADALKKSFAPDSQNSVANPAQ